MRFDERLRIVADAQGDPALLSFASVNLLLCDRPTREQENLREALKVAAVPHWVNEEILPYLLEPALSGEAETLTALLRRLPIVEQFPARGPGAINVHDAVRLVLRTQIKARRSVGGIAHCWSAVWHRPRVGALPSRSHPLRLPAEEGYHSSSSRSASGIQACGH